MDKNMGAFRKGFTIIELMLFLALSGLVMVGILGGLGGNIARQRYNDAVQDVVNMLRDQYSFVSDTQIAIRSDDTSCYGLVGSDFSADGPSDYYKMKKINTPESMSFRGRTNCVVYGAVISINEDYMETTELLGRDYQSVARSTEGGIPLDASELEVLYQYVTANNMSVHCYGNNYTNCFIRSADNTHTQTTKWGTKMQNIDGTPLRKTLLIFRSPRDGAIRTYVMDKLVTVGQSIVKYADLNKENDGKGKQFSSINLTNYGINEYFKDNNFKVGDLDICLDSGDTQTYNSARRLIKVRSGAKGQSDVELINLDVAKEESEGSTSGATSCQ